MALEIRMDMEKLPLLLVSAVLFLISGFFLTRANLKMAELMDLNKLSFVADRLLSYPLILFVLFLALTIAIVALYARGISWNDAFYVLPFFMIISALLTLISPDAYYFWVFFALGVGITIMSVFASGNVERDLWGVCAKGFLIIVLAAFLFGSIRVGSNSEYYFGKVIDGTSSIAQNVQGDVLNIYVSQLTNIPINRTDIAALLSNNPSFVVLTPELKNASIDQTYAFLSSAKNGILQNLTGAVALNKSAITSLALKYADKSVELKSFRSGLGFIVGLAMAGVTALGAFVITLLSWVLNKLLLRFVFS